MTPSRRVDVAIVGAGSAGLSALREVKRHTGNFVVVNQGPWGTMCARVGCMPSKALVEAANAFHRRKHLAEFGALGCDALTIDTAAVMKRVRRIRDELVRETCELTDDLGDRAISGRARLLGPDRIAVGEQEIAAKRIVLTTGSRPVVPAKWRALSERLVTTDTLFEQPTLPKRVAVLGLGPLGVELAQSLARLGVEVTAFDGKGCVAGLEDDRINETLLAVLRGELTVHLGHEVELAPQGDAIRATAGGRSAVVDRVLVALGRAPNLDDLGLETLGVRLDEHGKPPVDPRTMQIAQLPVFLAGDAEGDRPRQHEASDEGHIAGANACAPSAVSYRRRVPLGIVFTDPTVALVGTSYAQLAREKVAVGEASFADQGRARLGLRGGGRLRIYAEKEAGAVLGAELCAPGGEHLGHWLALAIERKCTVEELLWAPFYHPCLEEGVRTALREVRKNGAAPEKLELERAEH